MTCQAVLTRAGQQTVLALTVPLKMPLHVQLTL